MNRDDIITKSEMESFGELFSKRLTCNTLPKLSDLEEAVEIKKPTKYEYVEDVDISVITVCYNPLNDGRKEMFLQCLDSVQSQKGVTLEHIIVDGGSNDGTLLMLRSYNNPHYTIRLFSKEDSGIFEAMNRGLVLAKGEYVVYLNTDDFYHDPEGLRTSLDMLRNTGCDFSFAPIRVLSKTSKRHYHNNPLRHLHLLFVRSVISHQSLVVKRSVMCDLCGFSTAYHSAADYEMLIRMLLTGHRGCYLDRKFVSYRMTGLSSVNLKQSVMETSFALYILYNRDMKANISVWDAYMLHTKLKNPDCCVDIERKLTDMIHSLIVVKTTDSIVGYFFHKIKCLIKLN